MLHQGSHPSDQDLLLAADGELSAPHQNELHAHLRACWTCRARMAELESTIADFVNCYHSLPDSQLPPGNGFEHLLKARLVAEGSPPPKLQQFSRWRWPIAGAFALLALLGCTFFWRPQVVLSFETKIIPNPSLTPGETSPASRSDVCQTRTPIGKRQVPEALREAVFSEYGMKDAPRNAYEVDFLITPELGGTASIRNLWPEPYFSRAWNAHAKDALEERLHSLVCSGDLDLSTAQREIATNWVDAYKKYVRTDSPM